MVTSYVRYGALKITKLEYTAFISWKKIVILLLICIIMVVLLGFAQNVELNCADLYLALNPIEP